MPLGCGLGATRMRSGSLLVGRGLWVWLFVVSVPCILIGPGRESAVWKDLRAGPTMARGMVTAASSDDAQGTDSHGNTYDYTIYHLTVAGLTFTSSVDAMADLYTRVPQGHCVVVTYGRYSHTLTAIAPCGAR